MKAWILSLSNDDDQGQAIVFADSAVEAKKKLYETDLDADGWIYIRARRYPTCDDMQSASEVEMALTQWRNGWQWDDYRTPCQDETSDEEFIEWFEETFGGRR